MGQQCASCPSGDGSSPDQGIESVSDPNQHNLRLVDHMKHWSKDTVGPEALGWVNKLLEILWPDMDKVANLIIRDKITPRMQEVAAQKMPKLKGLRFAHFTLGKATPKVTGLHVSTTPFGGSKVRMVVDYQSDMAVELELSLAGVKMSIGMKDFHLSGEMCVLMRPVMEDYPGNVGGMTMYFVNRPRIDLDFTGVANIADIGGIRNVVRQTMSDVLAEKMVLPNAITNLISYDDITVYPPVIGPPHPPIGALSIKLVKAADIRDGDFNLNPFSTKVEDNYVKFAVGDVTWKAPIGKLPQERTFPISDVMQTVTVSVWDEDTITADDFLGSVGEFTMSEIEALSGKDIPVHDPSRKEGEGGVLQMEVQFYNVRPFRLGATQNIVVMQVQEVLLHSKPDGKVCVRAKLGSETRTTRASNPMVAVLKTKTVQSVIQDVRERLKKEGVENDVIERVTALEGLQAVSQEFRVPTNFNISFPVATEDLSSSALDIEIVKLLPNKKECVMGTFSHPLEVLKNDPGKEVDERLDIDGKELGKIQVKASMFVCALEEGTAPEGGKLVESRPAPAPAGGGSAQKEAESGHHERSSHWKFHFPFSRHTSRGTSA